MKITIDTINKTLVIDEGILLSDFIVEIENIIPNWKEYRLIPKPKSFNPYKFLEVGKTTPALPYTPFPQPLGPYEYPYNPNNPFNPMPIWVVDPNSQPRYTTGGNTSAGSTIN